MVTNERGFTLVEAVIAMAMLTIIGAATVGLLRNQDIFYNRIDDSTAAQQNLRAAADLLGSEIRMSMAGDIIAARADSVSVRYDIFQAVACDDPSGGLIPVYVYERTRNPNITGGMSGMAIKGPYQTQYTYDDGFTPTTSTIGPATCTGNGAPSTGGANDYLQLGFGGFSGALPPLPSGAADSVRGSIIRSYSQLTYSFAPSQIGNGWALYRNGEELIGPLDASSGFEYILASGVTQSNVGTGNLANIRYVRVNAVATDDDPRFDFQRQLAFDIPLRN